MRSIWLSLVVIVLAWGHLGVSQLEEAAGQVAKGDPKKGKGDPESAGGDEQAEYGKPVLTVDYAGHVDKVCSYDFTPDGKKLITLSPDNTIQVWDLATRERLKTLRLPFAKSFDGKRVEIVNDRSFVQVAPDGKTLVVSLGVIPKTRIINEALGPWCLVHLETGRIIPFAGLPDRLNRGKMPLFSPDGDTVIIGHFNHNDQVLRGFKNVWQPESPAVTPWKEVKLSGYMDFQFSADGTKLKRRPTQAPLSIRYYDWDLEKETSGPGVFFKRKGTGLLPVKLAWNPQGTRLAIVLRDKDTLGRAVEVWTADGLFLRAMTYDAPTKETPMPDPVFRGENEVLLVGASMDKAVPAVLRFDVKNGRLDEVMRFTFPDNYTSGKFAPDGQRLLLFGGVKRTRKFGEIGVLDLEANAKVQPLYAMPPAPKLAFSKQGRRLAWTGDDDGKLIAGIDLQTGEPVPAAELKAADYLEPAGTAVKDGFLARPRFSKGGAIDILVRSKLHMKVFFTVYLLGQDCVICTPEGYYNASPASEKMVGWHIDNGPNKVGSFYPLERFRKKLYRPDVIALVLERGSVAEALKVADTLRGEATGEVHLDEQLPPRAVLTVLDQSKLPAVTLKVRAEASSKKQPVTALRLLVDGRPLPEGAAYKKFEPGQEKAEADWSITLSPGAHQLTVLARCPDSSSKSNSIEIAVADRAKQNALRVLAVGVSDYEERTLKLDFAAKDAEEIAANFEKCSKGGLFTEVHGETLVNAKARKDAILKQVAELRKQAKPNDLVVIFFAGHGVKEKDKFYLLTVEADTAELAKTAISGEELRKALSEFPCQVLLMLDACHSSGSLKNFRSAVDDITRNLTDDDCGVAVMCAAMAHEKALEKSGNGLFTRAVVQALNRADGVPYNRHNRLLYVHHLHTFVFDEVSQQSNDQQHPFLSLPWVVESFPVARFAAK